MSVLLETSLGDIVIDLRVDECPKICEKYVLSQPGCSFLFLLRVSRVSSWVAE